MHLELVTIFEGMARTIFESMGGCWLYNMFIISLVEFVKLVILVFLIHASFVSERSFSSTFPILYLYLNYYEIK